MIQNRSFSRCASKPILSTETSAILHLSYYRSVLVSKCPITYGPVPYTQPIYLVDHKCTFRRTLNFLRKDFISISYGISTLYGISKPTSTRGLNSCCQLVKLLDWNEIKWRPTARRRRKQRSTRSGTEIRRHLRCVIQHDTSYLDVLRLRRTAGLVQRRRHVSS